MIHRKIEKTKDLLLVAALRLFAEKGYEAVSVSKIAGAVGLSAAALYKHFESKQALFDALIKKSEQEFNLRLGMLNVDFQNNPQSRKEFIAKPEEEQIAILMNYFVHTLEDELPALFRKMLIVEQFNRPDLAILYNARYVDVQLESFIALFQEFIDAGLMKTEDTYTMAIQFYSPGSFLINVCDREPAKKEESLKIIERQIRHFFKTYKI